MAGIDRIFDLSSASHGLRLESSAKLERSDASGSTKLALARELEATFLSLLLKEMRQTLEPEGLFAGDSSDVQGGLFDLYLGKHLADQGGVGLADAIIRTLNPAGNASKPTATEPRNFDRAVAPQSRP